MKFRSKSIFHIYTLSALLASLLGSALTVTPAYAAGITVNTTSDEDNTGGSCSLREAITAANTDAAYGGCTAGSGADIITLPAGTYTLTIAGAGDDLNTTGDLDITASLTINGAGAGTTIVQAGATAGSGIDRVFHVVGAIPVSISDITIANGKCISCSGGGISNSVGVLSVTSSTILGNSATNSASGGGISNGSTGTLTVSNSTFSGNSTPSLGGGIFNDGSLTVTNSTFSGNSSGFGGGIVINSGIATVTNSTFSGNSTDYGGGIYNGDTLTITNSTFSGNSATISGGGIYNGGTLTMTNNTLSGNSAATSGGGIYTYFNTLNLKNTVLANSVNGGDCYNTSGDTITTDANNLIETNGPVGHMCGSPTVTSDPALSALADNGGPTQTFALPPSSVALGAGTNTGCPSTDQRGVTRPQSGACDIGAYESNAQPGPAFVVNTNDDSTDGFCDAYVAGVTDCTLREAITYGNSIGGTDTITFAANYTITLASQLPAVTDTMIINGNGAANTIIQANATPDTATYRVFEVSNTGNLTLDGLSVQNGRCNGSCATGTLEGGGIRNAGSLTVTNSLVSNNYAGYGAGIYNEGTLSVMKSTFSNNSSNANGGGLLNGNIMNVTNSTFSGNYALGSGGGIFNGLGTLTVTNSTFSNNSAASGNGSGINNQNTLHLKNTILANSAAGSDCYNSSGNVIASNINNLIETNGSSGHLCGTPTVSADPNLGLLTGSPGYFPLNVGSPAIDAGDDTVCAAAPVSNASQNGVTRPQDSHCDIGAYEKPDTTSPTVSSSVRVDSDPTALASVHFTVTFSESVTGVDAADFSLTITGLVTGATVSGVTGSGTTYTVTVNTGSGNGTIRLDVLNDGTIKDAALNPLSSAFTSGEAYTVNRSIKTVSSVGVNDGWILESKETSNKGGTMNSTATTFNLGDDLADRQYRAILHFDTSSLPDTAVITSATLKIKRQGIAGTNPFTILGNLRVDMRKPAFGAATLALADFKSAAGVNNVSTFGVTPVANWYSAILNSAGNSYINRTGSTQFRLYFTTDDNNDNGNDYMKFHSGNAGAASRPQLIIEYYVP